MCDENRDVETIYEQENFYKTIFKLSTEIICIVDLNTKRFTIVNPAFKAILGEEEAEIYSKPITDFIYPEDVSKTEKVIEERLKLGKEVISFENRYLGVDGVVRLLSWNAHLIPGQEKIFAIAHDITEQRKYEEELKFQALLLDNIQDRITATDLEVNITYINEAECSSFGRSREELLQMNVKDYGDNPSRGATQEEILREALQKGYWRGNVVNYSSLGKEMLYDARIQLYYDHNGKPAGMIGISTDITESQNMLNKLQDSQRRFRTMFEQGAVGQLMVSDEGEILAANSAICEMLGYTKEELSGMSYEQLVYPSDIGLDREFVNKVIDNEIDNFDFELRLIHKFGYLVWVRLFSNAVRDKNGKALYALGAVVDNREIRASQQALRENEELFRTIFSQSAIGIAQISEDGDYLQVNPRYCEITGYSESELLEKSFRDITYTEDLEEEAKLIDGLNIEKKKSYHLDKRITHKDGRIIWISEYYKAVKAKNNTIKYAILSISDITEQKKNVQRLLNLSTRLTLAVESAEIGIWEYNIIQDKLYWDERTYQLFGVKRAEFCENLESGTHNIHPDDQERVKVEFGEAINGKRDFDTDFRVVWSDNSIHYLRAFALLEKEYGKPKRMVGINYDITEARNYESRLKSALAEKNTLLRELTHRTKNNMQVICSMLDLESINSGSEEVKQIFAEMSDRIYTMALVHTKLYQSDNLSRLDLSEYIRELANLMIKSKNSGRDIQLEISTEPMEVLIDTVIPCGLILNELISNTLKYAFSNQADKRIVISLKKQGTEIHLYYGDNGGGFPEGFNFETDRNLGLLLLQKLINIQLRGKMRYQSENGLEYEFKFNDDYYKERV
jgi:PAS domain S-box-containing protein